MHWYGKLAVVNLLCFASLGLNINGAWAQTGTGNTTERLQPVMRGQAAVGSLGCATTFDVLFVCFLVGCPRVSAR